MITKILSIISGLMFLYATFVLFRELFILQHNYKQNDFEEITESHTRHHISIIIRGWFAFLSLLLLLFHEGLESFITHFILYNLWIPVVMFSSFFVALTRHLKQERKYGDNKTLDLRKEMKNVFKVEKR